MWQWAYHKQVSIKPRNNNATHVTTAAEGIRMQRVIWHFKYYGNITISKNIAEMHIKEKACAAQKGAAAEDVGMLPP